MVRRSKLVYIIGSIAIGVMTLLAVFGILIATGAVNVTQTKLVIASKSETFVYDGTVHKSENWEIVEGSLQDGHTLIVTATGGQEDVGSSPNYITAKVVDENKADVSEYYEIEYQYGTISVVTDILHIVSESKAKVYDGTPLSAHGYVINEGSIPDGHRVELSFSNTITNVGVIKNAFVASVYDEEGNDKTTAYAITTTFGNLEITPRDVYLETGTAVKEYDGKPLQLLGVWLTEESPALAEGDEFADIVTSQLNVIGDCDNKLELCIIKRGDVDVTSNYSLNVAEGKLIMMARPLAVRTDSASKEYDGEPLTCETWQVVSLTEPVEGHTVEVAVCGTQTEVGESDNEIAEVRITDADGNVVTQNYDIEKFLGTLSVKAKSEISDPEEPDPEDPDPEEPTPPGGEPGPSSSVGPIGGGGGGGEPYVVLSIYADYTGEAYLRIDSAGDYTGRSWLAAKEYGDYMGKGYSLNYLTSSALAEGRYTSYEMLIDIYDSGSFYVLPYYAQMGGSKDVQTSDVYCRGDSSSVYSVWYYPYTYIADGAIAGTKLYDVDEERYRSFVYTNYLQVADSTKACLNDIIAAQGFSKDDPDIVAKVAKYIQSAAEYNSEYDTALDSEADIVSAFLTTYGEGICQHYASSATLLFRQLGIPARYVSGFAANTVEGTWQEVTNMQAHAWTEVYIDGLGWVYVEVTGGGPGGGGGGETPEEPEEPEGPEESKEMLGKLNIKPVDVHYEYKSGEKQTYKPTYLQGLADWEKEGYTYEFKVDFKGSYKEVGYTTTYISKFIIYNPEREDVTDLFEISKTEGTLHVYMFKTTLKTGSASKEYDGTALTSDLIEIGALGRGHTYIAKAIGARTDAGRSVNGYELVILDAAGEDVTDMYLIDVTYGILEISPRAITVTADSATAKKSEVSPAEPLKASGYTLTDTATGTLTESEALVAGHTVTVTVEGQQSSVGYSNNKVTEVVIVDEKGKDVTRNYNITSVDGELRVTR